MLTKTDLKAMFSIGVLSTFVAMLLLWNIFRIIEDPNLFYSICGAINILTLLFLATFFDAVYSQ